MGEQAARIEFPRKKVLTSVQIPRPDIIICTANKIASLARLWTLTCSVLLYTVLLLRPSTPGPRSTQGTTARMPMSITGTFIISSIYGSVHYVRICDLAENAALISLSVGAHPRWNINGHLMVPIFTCLDPSSRLNYTTYVPLPFVPVKQSEVTRMARYPPRPNLDPQARLAHTRLDWRPALSPTSKPRCRLCYLHDAPTANR